MIRGSRNVRIDQSSEFSVLELLPFAYTFRVDVDVNQRKVTNLLLILAAAVPVTVMETLDEEHCICGRK